MILYLTGLIPAALSFKDLFSRKNVGMGRKLVTAFFVFIFSWIGFYIYEITKQESISQKILWTCMAICWFGIILKDIPIVF